MLPNIVIFLTVVCLQFLSCSHSLPQWNVTLLESEPPVAWNISLTEMVERKMIAVETFGCITNCQQPHHSTNKFFKLDSMDQVRDPEFLNGTTFWINEHMSVG
jgi:hypothetical protein